MNSVNLIGSSINEIQKLRADLRTGRISPESYKCQLAGIITIFKGVNLMLKASMSEFKNKKFPDLKALTDVEIEMLKCPAMDDKSIARSECLDYSGSQKLEECSGCKIGKETKKLLLPEN